MYSQYGPIEEMNVCDNLGDHLVGNVYIKVPQDAPKNSPYMAIICTLCGHVIPCACYYLSLVCIIIYAPPFSARVPQFKDEESSEKAVISLNNRWYNGLPIHAELSPVTDFREACCRQYEMG